MTGGRGSRTSRSSNGRRYSSGSRGPRTLAIDIGGTALKASVLDGAGRMVVERVRVPTPYPCPPKVLLNALVELTAPLPAFDRVSIGFPGVVRNGLTLTAPHFEIKAWHDYPLEAAAAHRFGRPARLLNDAEVQGLGIIAGKGLEVVLTLGTGVGSAVFRDGWLAPHLELAQHPLHDGKTYNDYVGNEALHRHGKKRWNHRVLKTIEVVRSLLHYDVLYLGGGNARHLTANLPRDVRTASNDTGITGGIYLWDESVWQDIRGSRARDGAAGSAANRLHRTAAMLPPRSSSSTKPSGKLS
jgi:polyphosphate glucokinase